VILFAIVRNGIQRVPASGGAPSHVVGSDESRKETEQWFPSFLPDGKHFLYYSWNGNRNDTAIYTASLDGSERKLLFKNDSNVAYSPAGYLLFARDSTLMAQGFDAAKLELSGDPFPVSEQVVYSPNLGYSNFSVSESGTMVYWGWMDPAPTSG